MLDPALAPKETLVYRPVYFAYGVLAYRIWGRRPWAWHAGNVLLHAVASCLVLIALRRLFDLPPATALGACLIWAVHPVHVQAVTYVAAVAYLLMGIFLLIAVLVACGWWFEKGPVPLRVLAAVGAFAISVLNHELGLMAPALTLLVLAAGPPPRRLRGRHLDRGTAITGGAMAVAALAYVVLRLTLIGTGTAGYLVHTAGSLGSRLLQAPEILLRYLAILALPIRLTLDRSHDVPFPSGTFEPRVLAAWTLCILLAWVAVRASQGQPLVAFGGAWFLVAYFPVSNTSIPLYSVMGEQYIYIASVGILAGAVALGRSAALALGVTRAAPLVVTLLVAVLGGRTITRNFDWHDDLSFYRATVAASPKSAYMHNNLGVSYFRRGQMELSDRQYRAALEADPTYFPAYVNLGNVALERGHLDEAEASYRRAEKLRPDYAEGSYGLATVAHRRGQEPEALHLLERASTLTPAFIETDLHLGVTYLGIDPGRAARHLRRFLALAPDHPQAAAARAYLSRIPSQSSP